jgi:hypothetical protein
VADRLTRRVARRLQEGTGPRARRDLGYVFIVTYGRSGSTLLQGVLNSIPGYLVRGENRQALRHLRALMQITRTAMSSCIFIRGCARICLKDGSSRGSTAITRGLERRMSTCF